MSLVPTTTTATAVTASDSHSSARDIPPLQHAAPSENTTQYEQNLQGILNFAISQTDGSTPADEVQSIDEMDPERKAFLATFLESLQGKDHMSVVKEALGTVLDTASAEEDKLEALETIADEVEDINIAEDFIAVKGLAPTKALLSSKNPEFQWRAADIVARMTQNHPKGQSAALNHGLLAAVLPLLAPEGSDLVRLKAVHALSCMVRGSMELFDQFCSDASAFDQVMGCLTAGEPSDRLKVKTIVFLKHLVRGSKKYGASADISCPPDALPASKLHQPGALTHITSAMVASAQHDPDGNEVAVAQLWEHGLQLLCDLHQENEHLVTKLREDLVPFVDAVSERHNLLSALQGDDKAAHQEEIAAYKKLFE